MVSLHWNVLQMGNSFGSPVAVMVVNGDAEGDILTNAGLLFIPIKEG